MAKSPEFPAYEFSQQLTSLSDFIVVCSQPDFLEWQLFFLSGSELQRRDRLGRNVHHINWPLFLH